MKKHENGRRAVITGLGVAAAVSALGGQTAAAQIGSATPFSPTLHAQDAWMANMPGKHRVVLDITSPAGVPDGIRFAGNIFNGNRTGYGVEESEMAILMCLRHQATAYGYGDAIWKKYGAQLAPDAKPAPTANQYNTGERAQLPALVRRGVQIMVCGTASRGIATRLAGPGGDVEAMLKEMAADVVPSGRIVVAGVVAVTHAQEHGFTMLYVG
ncbi:MAG: hypothetical protein ABL986_09805 [Vicinamibacterales bacterium]